MGKVELLAPAGNYESFIGAVNAGADAVYLGGDKFGARAFAENFSTEQLCDAIHYAHLFNRKVYLTLNTLIKEKEFGELYSYIQPFYEAGLDGIIIQDMGVFAFVRRNFPHLPLHVSTQMTVTGVHGTKLLKEEGAVRIVPARELSLQEIREIKDETGLEMETFIHGAMCYCYSGQCLFSSFLGGRSGNRGKCAQPCRLPYEVLEKGKAVTGDVSSHPLSLKDMCTVKHIPDLIEAGIDSFKIEGRMKKPEYAAGVTAIYRKYIDLYYKKGRDGFRVSEEDMKLLETLYIRSEIQDGYYFRHNGKEMITREAPGYSGSDDKLLGQIRNRYLEKTLKLPVQMQAYFHKDSEAVLTMSCGDVYVTVTGQVVQRAANRPVTEQNIRDGLCALGETYFETESVEIDAQEDIFYPLKAIKDLRREAVQKLTDAIEQEHCPELALRKSGMEPGQTREVEKTNETTQENATERKAENTTEKTTEKAAERTSAVNTEESRACAAGLRVFVTKEEQLQWLLKQMAWKQESLKQESLKPESLKQKSVKQESTKSESLKRHLYIDRIYLDGDICEKKDRWQELFALLADRKNPETQVFIALPYILRKRDGEYLDSMAEILDLADGCLVRNMEGYAFLKEQGFKKEICGDAGLYQWNRECRDFWLDKLSGFCVPYELNSREQKVLTDCGAWEQVVYGRQPMMVTANCVAKTSGGCLLQRGAAGKQGEVTNQKFSHSLKDRYNAEFPVYTNCRHCYNIIYNSVPLSLHDKVAAEHPMTLRLDFTTESGAEAAQIVEYFGNLLEKGCGNRPYDQFTTGHEKKGAL